MSSEQAYSRHPRVAKNSDNTGIQEFIYHRLCARTSYKGDEFNAKMPGVDRWKPSEVVITHKRIRGDVITGQQLRTGLNNLIKLGAVVLVGSEGKFGNRYFLPHQYATLPEKFKKEQQATNRQLTGKQQATNRQSDGANASSVGAEVACHDDKQQATNRQLTGKQQATNNSTKKEERIKKELIDDDDARGDEKRYESRGDEVTYQRIKKWYLELDGIERKWTSADEAILEGWIADGYDLIEVINSLILGSDRSKTRVNSLSYFDKIVRENEIKAGMCKTN